MATENGKLDGVVLFLAGGLLGAAIALLLAPQSGKKTRRDIAYLGRMAKKKSEQIQLELGHAIDNLVEGISEKVQDSVDRGREWTDKTAKDVVIALNSGKDFIQKEIEKVMQARV